MIFAMNMMRPRPSLKKRNVGAALAFFMRSWEHHSGEESLLNDFTGVYKGGLNGSMTWTVTDKTVKAFKDNGNDIWLELFLGFSFAEEDPGINSSTTSTKNNSGWYVYNKYEWWPHGSEQYPMENGPYEPSKNNIRSNAGYDHFYPGIDDEGVFHLGYKNWFIDGIIANGCKWVCIGLKDVIFATGKLI